MARARRRTTVIISLAAAMEIRILITASHRCHHSSSSSSTCSRRRCLVMAITVTSNITVVATTHIEILDLVNVIKSHHHTTYKHSSTRSIYGPSMCVGVKLLPLSLLMINEINSKLMPHHYHHTNIHPTPTPIIKDNDDLWRAKLLI
jgi:hypothetical protein